VKEDGDFLIYDHGSKNGTWINEMRVPFNGSSVLENGDVIELGRGGVQLRFEREKSENENGG
jgi:predicted component of type VI protein secretion system